MALIVGWVCPFVGLFVCLFVCLSRHFDHLASSDFDEIWHKHVLSEWPGNDESFFWIFTYRCHGNGKTFQKCHFSTFGGHFERNKGRLKNLTRQSVGIPFWNIVLKNQGNRMKIVGEDAFFDTPIYVAMDEWRFPYFVSSITRKRINRFTGNLVDVFQKAQEVKWVK